MKDEEYWEGYTKEEAEKVLGSLERFSVPSPGELPPNCPYCGESMKFYRYGQLSGGHYTCFCSKMSKRETNISLFFWALLGGLIILAHQCMT